MAKGMELVNKTKWKAHFPCGYSGWEFWTSFQDVPFILEIIYVLLLVRKSGNCRSITQNTRFFSFTDKLRCANLVVTGVFEPRTATGNGTLSSLALILSTFCS